MSNAEKENKTLSWIDEMAKTWDDHYKKGVEHGRAAMLAEIKNRMPTDEALNYKMTYEMGRLLVIDWLKTKLFGGHT